MLNKHNFKIGLRVKSNKKQLIINIKDHDKIETEKKRIDISGENVFLQILVLLLFREPQNDIKKRKTRRI